jgi:energy-coupling factor transport system permease protein
MHPSHAQRRTGIDARRVPRNLHPVAWWMWALGLVVAASRTTNPLLLVLIIAVAGTVVVARRSDAPWARAFRYYLIFGAVIIALRVASRVVFGGGTDVGVHVLFRLPEVPLPGWASDVRLGGPVSLESVLAASFDGLRLATLIICIGAANALANPKRALRSLPGALSELGVAVVISITVAPQLITSIQRVRRARKLRGGAQKGFRALRSIALPVLQDALDRSLLLAAAMDSRGYGRRVAVPDATRRATSALLVGGLMTLCLGSYGTFGGGTSARLALPVMAVGVALCVAGLMLGGNRVLHTDHRPDPWGLPECLVAGAGLGTALVLGVVGRYDPTNLAPSLYPLSWPALPIVPVVGILLAATAGLSAPPPPAPVARRRARVEGPSADRSPAAPEVVAA